ETKRYARAVTVSSDSHLPGRAVDGTRRAADLNFGELVAEQRIHIVAGEFLTAFQKVQLEDKAEPGDFSIQIFDQAGDCGGRSASGEHVVDDEDALARRDCILVDLKHVGTVLQRVFDSFALGGQLLFFAHRNESVAESVGDGGRDDEAAGFDAEHDVNG